SCVYPSLLRVAQGPYTLSNAARRTHIGAQDASMRVGCARPQDADKLPGCRHARWVRETARRTQARWVVHRAGGAAAYRTHTIPLGSPSRGTHTRAAGRTQEPRDAHKSRGTHTRAAGRTQEP